MSKTLLILGLGLLQAGREPAWRAIFRAYGKRRDPRKADPST